MPYTYVEACKISGMLLKQIFVQDGQPIRMHIDSSIANVNVRATLATRIMVSPRIFLHLYRWAKEVDRGWPRRAQEGQDGLVGVHGCNGLNACMAAFWRRSHGERSICARHPRGPEHGDLPASRQDVPRRAGQVRRVVSVGQEVHREGASHLYARGLQEPRRTSTRRRVRLSRRMPVVWLLMRLQTHSIYRTR